MYLVLVVKGLQWHLARITKALTIVILLQSIDIRFPYFGLRTDICSALDLNKTNIDNIFSSEKNLYSRTLNLFNQTTLWQWFLKCGPQASGGSISWELVRNTDPRAPPSPTESETLGWMEPSSLSFNTSSRGFCLECENQGLSSQRWLSNSLEGQTSLNRRSPWGIH